MAIVIGIVGNTGYQFLFIEGIKRTTASNTSLILSLTPVFVAMMSALLKFERLHWAAWGGIFISFLGLYLVIARGNSGFHFSGQNFRGDLMIFLATIFWALYTVLARPALEKVSALKFTSLTIAIGTFFYLPLAASDIRRLPWREISLGGWAYLLYSAVFALVLGMVIWFISVKRVGNSRTAIYGNITPIFTVLFAHLILSEGLSTFQAAGALVILAGVYLTRAGYRIFEKRPATT
jgi:drug/metabolite transporter (DMT)-like permease